MLREYAIIIIILTMVLGVNGQLKFAEVVDRTNFNSDTLYGLYTGSSDGIVIIVSHSNGNVDLSLSKQ